MQFIKEDIYAAARMIGCSYQELVSALEEKITGEISIVPLFQDAPVHEQRHPPGRLCRLSNLGKEQGLRRNSDGLGRAQISQVDSEEMIKVWWDRGEGRWTSGELYHKDLIEILGD